MTNDKNLEKLLNRIVIEPTVMMGKPTIRGYRVTVEQILKALASGITFAQLVEDYPFLENEDVDACLLYAAKLVEEERIYILKTA
jgi:uncharacterized protein (DUF433 family)